MSQQPKLAWTRRRLRPRVHVKEAKVCLGSSQDKSPRAPTQAACLCHSSKSWLGFELNNHRGAPAQAAWWLCVPAQAACSCSSSAGLGSSRRVPAQAARLVCVLATAAWPRQGSKSWLGLETKNLRACPRVVPRNGWYAC